MTVDYGLILDFRLWLGLGAVLVGSALGWATRWKHRTALRSWAMALGANLGAVGLLAAVLLAGAGELNAVHRPLAWAALGAIGLILGFLVTRWPRAVGLPVVVFLVGFGWWVSADLGPLVPWNQGSLAEVRVLAQSTTVRTVELRTMRGGGIVNESLIDLSPRAWPVKELDRVEFPAWVPVHPLQWWRPSDAPPSVVWTWLPSAWLSHFSPTPPESPALWVIYRLVPETGGARWVQHRPSLVP